MSDGDELSRIINDLRAENATLKRERDAFKQDAIDRAADCFEAGVKLEAAEAERDRLRQALAPLAILARAVDPSMEDAFEMTCLLTAGQLRMARAALTETNDA